MRAVHAINTSWDAAAAGRPGGGFGLASRAGRAGAWQAAQRWMEMEVVIAIDRWKSFTLTGGAGGVYKCYRPFSLYLRRAPTLHSGK